MAQKPKSKRRSDGNGRSTDCKGKVFQLNWLLANIFFLILCSFSLLCFYCLEFHAADLVYGVQCVRLYARRRELFSSITKLLSNIQEACNQLLNVLCCV